MSLFEKVEGISKTNACVMLGCGILCFFLAAIVIYLYVRKVRFDREQKNISIKSQESGWDSTIKFWKNYIYIFIAFVGIIGGIVLLAISIEYLK